MRLIGHLPNEKLARRFADYLFEKELESQVEPDAGGRWAVWVIDDEDMEAATAELESYRTEPDAKRYLAAVVPAEARRRSAARVQEAPAPSDSRSSGIWPSSLFERAGPVTLGFATISVVAFIAFLLDKQLVRQWLSIMELTFRGDEVYTSTRYLNEVRQGQVWRLVTPIFIHFDFLHILFNMWLFVAMGGAIERRYGSQPLFWLVVLLAVFSNLLEATFNAPTFGGMSGVVFGLFGFVLVQSKYNPHSGYAVSPVMTFLMLFWFVFCIVGQSGTIANFVHWGGLALGSVLGYVAAVHAVKKRRS